MQIILNLLIFCLVLFFYIHIYFHLKTSEDLEIFEVDKPSKLKLEEICDLKQPVLYDYPNEELINTINKDNINKNYGPFDVKIRTVDKPPVEDEEMYIPITFRNAVSVLEKSDEQKYIIENNQDFLIETGLIKIIKNNDLFIRPPLVSECIYDIMMGSDKVTSPFKYENNYRNYFMVSDGKVRVKLAPPKSKKYLYEIKDYENYEFRSPINPWDVQDIYKADFEKIKCLEIELNKQQILQIPPYWWYSIEFENKATILNFKYRTYMNTLAILPNLVMKVLQNQNIKRKIANTLPVS